MLFLKGLKAQLCALRYHHNSFSRTDKGKIGIRKENKIIALVIPDSNEYWL